MSERTQIDVQQGNKVIRIYSGWGIPRNILPALRAAASAGHSKPLDIAREIIRQVPTQVTVYVSSAKTATRRRCRIATPLMLRRLRGACARRRCRVAS
jgi:hypothetical protein